MLKIISILKTFFIVAWLGISFISAQNFAPSIPTIYAKADSGKIIINWTSEEAINSIDDSTGYRDFEGFRIYKSVDGGETWGGPDGRIYYNGEAKGWTPLAQFDLSVEEDSLFCLKSIDCEFLNECDDGSDCGPDGDISKCTDGTLECAPNPVRGMRISGMDPLAPWVNLGEDTGLEYTYTDEDVYNGKEYTYAVVSYDIGLRSYELSYVASADSTGICTALDGSESVALEEACCISNGGTWGDDLGTEIVEVVCSYPSLTLTCDDGSGNYDNFCESDDDDATVDPKVGDPCFCLLYTSDAADE